GKPYLLKTEDYVTCIGGANIDRCLHLTKDMIMGTSNPVLSTTSYGGVMRNIAENLARLDVKVSLMTMVGDDDNGRTLVEEASKFMEIFATDRIAGEKTGIYISILDTEGNMQIGFADMAITQKMDRKWIMSHKRHLSSSTWIVADTNMSKEAMETLIDFVKHEAKKLAIIGVSGPKMKNLPEKLDGVDIIICNRDETQAYFDTDENEIKSLCKMWLDKGVRRAVVTAGSQGCAYTENNEVLLKKAIRIDINLIVDVTGAGDAFSAAVIHGIVRGESLSRSIEYGIVSSGLTIQSEFSVNPSLSRNLILKEIEKYEEL
ncbi:MAG: carbohydrate kinase family protein, partial [Bacilli bacterium]|nr:carbohydrate kinase family protein [Bacilli bacterium]